MLIKINIDNFKSFSVPTELTMITSNKIQDTVNHRVKIKSTNILKNAVIYGANASGKSNLIDAIRFVRETLKYGLPFNCMQLFCKNDANLFKNHNNILSFPTEQIPRKHILYRPVVLILQSSYAAY